jgi:hypothetical protein
MDTPAPAPAPRARNFFSELGESDRTLYGMIGMGIIISLLIDAGVHMIAKPAPSYGLDRLQINGRIYVPLP